MGVPFETKMDKLEVVRVIDRFQTESQQVESVLQEIKKLSNTYGEALELLDVLYNECRGDKVKRLVVLEAKEVLEQEMFSMPVKKEVIEADSDSLRLNDDKVTVKDYYVTANIQDYYIGKHRFKHSDDKRRSDHK